MTQPIHQVRSRCRRNRGHQLRPRRRGRQWTSPTTRGKLAVVKSMTTSSPPA
jgi:hypothetical protein